MNQPITMTIEVLRVEGLDAGEARRMGSALESALGELLATGGLPRGLNAAGRLAPLALDGLAVAPGRPEQAGRDLARMLYRRLAR